MTNGSSMFDFAFFCCVFPVFVDSIYDVFQFSAQTRMRNISCSFLAFVSVLQHSMAIFWLPLTSLSRCFSPLSLPLFRALLHTSAISHMKYVSWPHLWWWWITEVRDHIPFDGIAFCVKSIGIQSVLVFHDMYDVWHLDSARSLLTVIQKKKFAYIRAAYKTLVANTDVLAQHWINVERPILSFFAAKQQNTISYRWKGKSKFRNHFDTFGRTITVHTNAHSWNSIYTWFEID